MLIIGLSPSARSIDVVEDTAPPVTSIILNGEAGNDGWYRSSVTVSIMSMDDMSGVAQTKYSFDNMTWSDYTYTLGIRPQGVTVIYYYSIDYSGNVEDVRSVTVMIDRTAPVSSISMDGDLNGSGWYVSDVNVTLAAYDGISGPGRIEYSVDGGVSWAEYEGAFSLSASGITTLSYRSIDVAGNVEYANTYTFMVDRLAPVTSYEIKGSVDKKGRFRDNATLYLSATDDHSGINMTECSFDDGKTWIPYVAPVLIADKGNIRITYRSIDFAGNIEAEKTINVNVH